jgi:hypothetical protein
MKFIDDNKLTDFDRQVLTLLAMAPLDWGVSLDAVHHHDLGRFVRLVPGCRFQQVANSEKPYYRRLSWRGQIRMWQAVNALQHSAVDIDARRASKESGATYQPQQSLLQVQQALTQKIAAMQATSMSALGNQLLSNPPAPPYLLGHPVGKYYQQGVTRLEVQAVGAGTADEDTIRKIVNVSETL